MQIKIEERTTEYYIVIVEQDRYDWIFFLNDGAIGQEPWASITQWCKETWGPMGIWGDAASPWKRMGPKYFFKHEQDRDLFVLRWA